MPIPSSTQRQRKLFRRFIVVSIVLHVMLVSAFFLPDYIRRLRAGHPVADAREVARERAQKRREAQTRAAEETKKQEAQKAAEEAKQEIAAELHDQFKAVVGDQLQPQDADQVWANLLAQLTAGLDSYSQQVADADAGDEDLHQGMTELQAKMLAELATQLREKNKKDLADSFIARVKSDVSPKLLEFYRHQLELKIGNALRDEGAKIVKDDAADIREKRRVVTQALADAGKSAAAAMADLASAKRKVESADKLAEAIRAAGKPDKADAKVADAVHDAHAAMESAGKSVEAAGEKLKEAAGKADGLSQDSSRAIHAAQDDIARTLKDVGKAADDAKGGIPADFAKSNAKATDTTSQLADAIKLAKENVFHESTDVSVEARTALKHARDEDLKQLIEKAFWENYSNKSAPRLGDKLTGAFKKTLEENGIKDDGVVADVDKRVKEALLNDVKDKIAAGQAGTDPLSKTLKLDDIAEALPAGADGSHHHHAETAGHHHGKATGADAGNDVADAGGDPATRDAADANDAAGNARENAIADRIGKTARDLVHGGIAGIGDDASGDDAAIKAARGPATAKHVKGDEDGDGDGDGLAGLASRVGRLADNVKDGRTDLADAAAAGNGGAAAGAGMPGTGAAGIGIPHRSAGPDRLHGVLLRNHWHMTDEAEYARLTGDIKNRAPNSVRGQATTRRSADGDIAAVSSASDSATSLRPAVVLVPAESKTEPLGQPQNSQPYVPKFKSIRFAAIPYRSKPVTIDGDLSEWKDVPELAMTSSFEVGPSLPAGLKAFPQAVKVQWDNTGFYLAYDVKDADNKITKAKPGDFWEGDGIEFWVDTLNTKEKFRTQCSHQFWAWVDGAANNPAQVGGEAQSWPGKDDYVPLGADVIKTASKKTEAGWMIEVFVPASRFRMLDLQPGRILGMNFSICTGTDLYYYWAGTTKVATARRPDTWGDVLLAGSAGRLECVDKLASELSQTETSKSLNAVRIGQPLRVRVTDADMNLSDAVKDRLAVTVATRRGTRQTMVLEETGNATGIFEGAIRTALDTGSVPNGVVPLLDGDQVDIIYIDQCRPDGARDVPVKLTLPVAASITKLSER